MSSRRTRGRARPGPGNSASRTREQPSWRTNIPNRVPMALMDPVRENVWPPRRPQSPMSPRFLRDAADRDRYRSQSARPGPRNRRQYFPRVFDVNKMFHYIVMVRDGKCTVEDLAKGLSITEELIPEFVMKRGSERMKFIRAEVPRKALVLAIHYNARICTFENKCQYFPHCKFFHLCKYFVIGSCNYGRRCRNSHDIFDHNNKRIVDDSGLSSVLNEKGILQVIRNSQPEVCVEYNQRGGCRALQEGGACNKFHICQRFLKGTCLLRDCKLVHTLSSQHNTMLKACFPKDFKTLTRMMLCNDVDEVDVSVKPFKPMRGYTRPPAADDTTAIHLNARRTERDVGTPPRHQYEFEDTENLTESDEDENPKSVRNLVGFFEHDAFSQPDVSAGALSQTRACFSQPDWTPRMFERNPPISRSSPYESDSSEESSEDDEGTIEIYSREKESSTMELQNGVFHGDAQTTRARTEEMSSFALGVSPSNYFASTASTSGPTASLRDLSLDSIGHELDSDSVKYKKVAEDFFNTMPRSFEIVQIQRIDIPLLRKEYHDRKLKYRNGQLEERCLFYGAGSEDVAKRICCIGFDPKLLTETRFGRGACFSRDAISSMMYSGSGQDCYMFRSKVIVGDSVEGDSSMNRPPLKPGQRGKRYDSTVNSKSNPTLFVVYDRACCYPEHLIKYRRNYVNLPNGNLPSAF